MATNDKTIYRPVLIPARNAHEGTHCVYVTLEWVCPVCGGVRGTPFQTASYDGSMRLICDGWSNPCGHIDKYSDVRAEALTNGFNDIDLSDGIYQA